MLWWSQGPYNILRWSLHIDFLHRKLNTCQQIPFLDGGASVWPFHPSSLLLYVRLRLVFLMSATRLSGLLCQTSFQIFISRIYFQQVLIAVICTLPAASRFCTRCSKKMWYCQEEQPQKKYVISYRLESCHIAATQKWKPPSRWIIALWWTWL